MVIVIMSGTLIGDECEATVGWTHIHVLEGASKVCLLEGDRTQKWKFPTDWTRQVANLG